MNIKILGTGCSNCKKLYAVSEEAANELGIDYSIEKVEDMSKIMSYGVMRTPALVIDEKVEIQGRIPTKKEVMEILKK